MAYPQPGMYQRPSWGGYASQEGGGWGGGSTPAPSWYHANADYSQNPAYRTNWGGPVAHPIPANPASNAPATTPAGTPDTLTIGGPLAQPQGSLANARATGIPNADGLIPFGGAWTVPYGPRDVAPVDYSHSNPMSITPPFSGRLPETAANGGRHFNDGSNALASALSNTGSGTTDGVTMVPGFGPGSMPAGVNITGGGNGGAQFSSFLAANPQIPIYTSQNGQYQLTSGDPNAYGINWDPNRNLTAADLAQLTNPFA